MYSCDDGYHMPILGVTSHNISCDCNGPNNISVVENCSGTDRSLTAVIRETNILPFTIVLVIIEEDRICSSIKAYVGITELMTHLGICFYF